MNFKYVAAFLCISSFSLHAAEEGLQQRFNAMIAQNTPIEQIIDELITTEPSNILALLDVSMDYACKDSSDLAQKLLTILIEKLGPENELIDELLENATLGCLDGDAVTVIAIAAGVDPTLASEATAAGPGGAGGPGNITAPAVPIGNGGGGGDSGISEL